MSTQPISRNPEQEPNPFDLRSRILHRAAQIAPTALEAMTASDARADRRNMSKYGNKLNIARSAMQGPQKGAPGTPIQVEMSHPTTDQMLDPDTVRATIAGLHAHPTQATTGLETGPDGRYRGPAGAPIEQAFAQVGSPPADVTGPSTIAETIRQQAGDIMAKRGF